MIVKSNNNSSTYERKEEQSVTYLSMEEFKAAVNNDPLYMATAEILCQIGKWVIKEN